jgi:excisionase family DNA binding protein
MWLLEHEVLAILEISRQAVYNLRKAGILPFYKVGNKTRYKKEDIDALVIERTVPQLQEPKVPRVVPRKFKAKIPVALETPPPVVEDIYLSADDNFI